MLFEDRPLTDYEKSRLHPLEEQVVRHYEYITKQSFNRLELRHLKKCIKVAYPKQINEAISFLYRKYPQNFTSFSYIVPYVTKVYKNKKGDDSNGQTTNKTNKTKKTRK